MTPVTETKARSVELIPVDDVVLDLLVRAAVTAASADDVTPPLTPGRAWTEVRVAWLRAYHHRCRSGLTGPTGEATWAVVVDDDVVGSVRLQDTDAIGVLETGIWLTRGTRGRGIGRMAITAVLREALLHGAQVVRADTTVNNTAALAMLRSLAFTITERDGAVEGLLHLDRGSPPDAP
jgi:RimJ/RimL family protein N-acetyltransferase